MAESTPTPEELETQAAESGYGAAEGETEDAPDQVQPTEVTRKREEVEDEDEDTPRGQAPR